MKKYAAALFGVFVLAFAVFAGGSIYLYALMRSSAYISAGFEGGRAAAEGVELYQRAVLLEHCDIETVWSPDSGTGGNSARWRFRDTVIPDRWAWVPSAQMDYTSARGMREYGPDGSTVYSGDPVADEIFRDMLADYSGSGVMERRVDLADYFEYYPIALSVFHAYSFDSQGMDVIEHRNFRVPMSEGEYCTATLQSEGGGYSFSLYPEDGSGSMLSSASVFAPGGYIYFGFDLLDSGGERPDGSLLPGGDWGVWRIPCVRLDGETPEGRWWTEDFIGEYDYSGLELVWSPPGDFTRITLELSDDGERVYAFTREDAGLYINVLDAASGECTGRTLVLTDEQLESTSVYTVNGIDFTDRGDYVLVSTYDSAAGVVSIIDGQPRTIAAIRADASLPSAGFYPDSVSVLDALWDGSRLVLLMGASMERDGDWLAYQAVCVYEDGERVFCELLTWPGWADSRCADSETGLRFKEALK